MNDHPELPLVPYRLKPEFDPHRVEARQVVKGESVSTWSPREGKMKVAGVGDWIMRAPRGEYYIEYDKDFREHYERAE
jgi:hypothetical protein